MTSGSAIIAIDDQVSTESGVDEDQISLTESQKEESKHSDVYFVSRPVYNKSNFFDRYNHEANKDKSCGEKIRSLEPEVSCERFLNVLLSFVPLLSWLPKYKLRRNLLLDIAAGLTIGVMNIPQG
ncbi:Prestin [Paramuricea clavata]|uniref:Prestin, partial n=1 Tax=Paramuricea clavata TaxID=317549 RepID=A0A6S7LJY9_PARCT|nr:Prestin [Paramuricea clavata]